MARRWLVRCRKLNGLPVSSFGVTQAPLRGDDPRQILAGDDGENEVSGLLTEVDPYR